MAIWQDPRTTSASTATVGVPSVSEPICIDQRIGQTKKNATCEDVGDWKFVI